MKPVRIALIGVNGNSHSIQIMNRLKKYTHLFELVGYVLPENERQRLPHKVERLEGLRELALEQVLNDPSIEAVAIETDEIYCTKYALLAAKAGKHVHMEKPGGTSLPEFEELIRTVKERKLVFCPGYMYRYNPYIMELLADIRAGKLGQILSVEAQMNCVHSLATRQFLAQFPGGMLFFLGCHLIDLIYLLQGEPNNVIPLSRSVGTDHVTAKDFGMVALEYDRGVSFAKCISTELGGYRRRQLVVIGTKGTVELKPLEWGPEAGMTTSRTYSTDPKWQTVGQESVSPVFDRYEEMLIHFYRCVRGLQENEYTPDYELALYKLLLRCCGETL